MSSLLKMNQKFLSKSSWSIRGGVNNNNNKNNNNHHLNNNLSSNNRYLISKNFINNSNSNNMTINNSNHFNNNNNNNQQQKKHPSLIKTNNNQWNKCIDNDDNDFNDNLVNNSTIMKPQPQSQLSKSHSITDLRELKQKNQNQNINNNNNNDDDSKFENEINERRIDMYIADIEMDPVFQLGSTIRAIYDGDEHDRFMEKLDLRIKNHDKDIERMCNCHYQGFVDCIHELLKVRPQAQDLKQEINQINDELLQSSENIQRKADELIKYRRILCNTKTAIEFLQECLPMLDTFSKLDQQMNEKKYYSALKTLEQFERLYINKFKKYRFTQTMCLRVPKIRETIKKESMKDLKDFLENIRQLTFKIGEIAMKNIAIRHKSKDYTLILSSNSNNKNDQINLKLLTMNGNSDDNNKILNGTINHNDIDDDYLLIQEELSATDLVDFSPVYRCLHIFGCLGAREQFESYYRQQRKQQARLILQSFAANNLNNNSNNNNLLMMNNANNNTTIQYFNNENFKNYLFGVVGFFVIEDHLLNTSNGLVTKEYLEENWNDIIKSLIQTIQIQTKLCNNCNEMLLIKNLLILFCETLNNYGYNIDLIIKLLIELKQLYLDILLKQWSIIFQKIFEQDTYHPLVINNYQEYQQYFQYFNNNKMELFMFNDNNNTIDKLDLYPKYFPYSQFVPKIYQSVKEFILIYLKFINDLNLSNNDKEDSIRKATNLLLTRTLSDSLTNLIKKPNLGLLQLIQISINTNYLEETNLSLELFISDIIYNNNNNTNNNNKSNDNNDDNDNKNNLNNNDKLINQSHLSRLQGRTMFKDSRSEAESQIYIQLNNKIEEFFSLANYNYMLTDSPGKASSYILDLMAFLKSTFEAFTNLPSKVAQTACLSACKFISSRLLNILLEDDVKAISHGFLQQFNLDLMQCEMFSGSEPVKEFEEGALQSCFAELRQTMDLFIEFDSWSTYFAEYGKNESRYLRVNPQTALILLEKLVRGDNKKTIFSSLSKNERDKKNKIDTILKKLRQLIN